MRLHDLDAACKSVKSVFLISLELEEQNGKYESRIERHEKFEI